MSKLTSRAVAVSRALRVGGVVILDLGEGRWWFDNSYTAKDFNSHYYSLTNQWRWRPLLRGLVNLGILPEKDVARHSAACDKAICDHNRRCDVRKMRRLAKQLGYVARRKKTRAQRR